ncbi:MAG: IS4/IS5 family transposase [Planctomycetes bacterium]|nr:IS4/IS5 family transposase [Planctomycetota bacterium]NOG55312.1 transposase [Planctomycetota bacterium]
MSVHQDTDGDVDANDKWYHFAYDDAWRIVATFREDDVNPKEQFVYHNAGLDGRGSSSYIDSVILRDKDASTGWTSQADALDEVRYYCQNWRADVSSIVTSGGYMVEWIKYSPYGIPFGLPVAVDTMSASPHESRLVQGLFDFMLTEELPQRVIGDKAYDSDQLDEQLANEGVELISPHRSNRRAENKTQDGRPLRRYNRRWTVERTISWIQHFRRLCIRWEKSTMLFAGFLHFCCALLLLREV